MTIVNVGSAIMVGMRARDVIVVARRRAGLTQQELGRRMGVPQATIARWESGFSEPKFLAVQKAVEACRVDLVFEFANADEGSWNSLIFEQLRRTPVERVRQLSRDGFDRVGALQAIGASRIRAVIVGEVAGALHGWPLMLDPHGALELLVHTDDRHRAEALFATIANTERIRMLDTLPGTTGYRDLARKPSPMDLDGPAVQVAALVDLLRVAHTENGRYSHRFARAFDQTLRMTERLRALDDGGTRKLTEQQAREETDRWLARQTAA